MPDIVTLHTADGSVLDAWESLHIKDEYTDPLGSMEFMVTPPREGIEAYRRRLQKGEQVTLKINDVPQASVLIETVRTKIGRSGGVVFTLQCKSLLAPMFEASVTPPDYTFRAQTDVPVSNVVLAVAGPFGFDRVFGDERANRDAITGRSIGGQGEKLNLDALKHNEAQAQEGETAYAMIARVITRLGICLRCSWDGALMLSRPNYDQAPSYTVVQSFARGIEGDYFIGDIEVVDTNEGQFSGVTVRGQAPDRAHSTRAARPTASILSSQLGDGVFQPYRSSAAPSKVKTITDKNARDIDRCRSVAALAIGMPARRAFTISGEVEGFTAKSGAVWNVDTVVTVRIDAIRLQTDMWILAREFRQDRRGGQMTRLTMIPKGFLVLGDSGR